MIIEVDPINPEPRKIRRAVEALQAGEVIAYPTDTVYGLGCDLFNKKAIDRLYQIKGMKKSQLLAFVCADLSDVARWAVVDNHVYRILKRYLPGPYCFILDATREVPKLVQSQRKTVGVRVPDHAVATALVRELGHPIISSTAARDDGDAHVDPRELEADFKGVSLVIDAGTTGIEPTSVVDLTPDVPKVIRAGAGDVSDFE